MTLAEIFLIGISPLVMVAPSWEPRPQSEATPPPSTQNEAATPSTNQPSPQSSQPAAPAKQPAEKAHSTTTHSTSKRPIHKRRLAGSGCDAAKTPAPGTAPSAGSSGATVPAGDASAQNAATPAPPKNCPPTKIIVRQGGTSEPSIQLAGGTGGDGASQERDTNQMLGTTEDNLKKAAGQQLSASQKDSVTQIQQFVAQSKRALAAGDMERARTLAWKAQLLSEDLLKPQN